MGNDGKSPESELPAPLVPADIDITGLDGFMLNVQQLFASELWALSTGDEFKAALGLWGRAWQQKPPGSLPADEKILAAFSGAPSKWKRNRAIAMRGFVLCSDGRFYHRVLCEDVLRAAEKREKFKARTKAASDARRLGALAEGPPESHRNDDRNDARNDDVTGTVTSDVTSVHRQGQGQGQVSKKETTAPAVAKKAPEELATLHGLALERAPLEPPQAPKPAEDDKPSPMGRRLPDAWALSPDETQWSMAQPGANLARLNRELEVFRDYWKAKPGAQGRKSDWSATWRNWWRKATQNSPGGGGRGDTSMTIRDGWVS